MEQFDPGILDYMMLAFANVFSLAWAGLTPQILRLLRYIFGIVTIGTIGWALTTYRGSLPLYVAWIIKGAVYMILVTSWQPYTEVFMNWIVYLGLQIGGGTTPISTFLQPSHIFRMSLPLTRPILAYVENIGMIGAMYNWHVLFGYSVILIISWLCFLLIACHVLIAVLEFQLLSFLSLMLLPLGLVPHLNHLAFGAIGATLGAAVRLGMLAVVASIIPTVLIHVGELQAAGLVVTLGNVRWHQVLAMLITAVVLLVLSWGAPRLASAAVGQPAMTGAALWRMGAAVSYGAYRGVRYAMA